MIAVTCHSTKFRLPLLTHVFFRGRNILRKGPIWSRNLLPKPKCALEAILQALETREYSNSDLEQFETQLHGPSSSSHFPFVGQKNGQEYSISLESCNFESFLHGEKKEHKTEILPDNSPIIPWRRGAKRKLRQPSYLDS